MYLPSIAVVPGLASLADSDGVANRLAVSSYIVKTPFVGLYNDCAGRIPLKANGFAGRTGRNRKDKDAQKYKGAN